MSSNIGSFLNKTYNFITSKPVTSVLSTGFSIYNQFNQYNQLSSYYQQQANLLQSLTLPSVTAAYAEKEALENIQQVGILEQAALAKNSYLEKKAQLELSSQQIEQQKQLLGQRYNDYLFNQQQQLQLLDLSKQKTLSSIEGQIKLYNLQIKQYAQAINEQLGETYSRERGLVSRISNLQTQISLTNKYFSNIIQQVTDRYKNNIWNLDIKQKQLISDKISNIGQSGIRLFGSAVLGLNNMNYRMEKAKNDVYKQYLTQKTQYELQRKSKVNYYQGIISSLYNEQLAIRNKRKTLRERLNLEQAIIHEKTSLLKQQEQIFSKMYDVKEQSLKHDITSSQTYIQQAYKNLETNLKWNSYLQAKLDWMNKLNQQNVLYQSEWAKYEKEKMHWMAQQAKNNIKYQAAFKKYESEMANWAATTSVLQNIYKMV